MPKLSIIIPVYNVEKYLQTCLDSIYQQSFTDWEIIAINDGSSDDSPAILKHNARQYKKLSIINQKNHGQGYARNRALAKASGDYVFFVDADDYLLPEALALTVEQAKANRADVVHFGWQMLAAGRDHPNQSGGLSPPFARKTEFSGEACDQFMQKTNYFAWDSLYRRSFLEKYKIRFGEGYIYEDNEFIVEVASHASKIILIDRPLYVMRENGDSSSRSQYDSPRHHQDFLKAMRQSFKVLRPRTDHSGYYLASYFLEKFIIYYERRVPRQYKAGYLREFIDIMAEQPINLPDGHDYRFFRWCVDHDIFAGRKYKLFRVGVIYKAVILPARDRLKKLLR